MAGKLPIFPQDSNRAISSLKILSDIELNLDLAPYARGLTARVSDMMPYWARRVRYAGGMIVCRADGVGVEVDEEWDIIGEILRKMEFLRRPSTFGMGLMPG
jgi:hypothetical protein